MKNMMKYKPILEGSISRVYGRGTWSFAQRGERRFRVCANSVLRRVLGPKRLENTACEELHNVYSSLNINRVIESRII
jgi:hypothetical protein